MASGFAAAGINVVLTGTEPLLRVMAEGENETQVRTMAEQIAASIRAVTA